MLTPNPFPLDLGGRTAVVTGAGGIMCSHFAGALAQAHATVCLLDINLPAAQAAADALTAAGYQEGSGFWLEVAPVENREGKTIIF